MVLAPAIDMRKERTCIPFALILGLNRLDETGGGGPNAYSEAGR